MTSHGGPERAVTVTAGEEASATGAAVPSVLSDAVKVQVWGRLGAVPARYLMLSFRPGRRLTPVTVISLPWTDSTPGVALV